MRIICVDDEPLVLEYTALLCSELPEKPEVRTFERAGDALQYLQTNDADIAILDINMPEMDGIMLAAEIKKLQPATAIIFLTGYAEYAVDAFAMHATGYILKPVSRERLADEVRHAVSIRPAKDMSGITAHTFGEFNLLKDGRPIAFARSKSKELLAFLIDRRGEWVSRQTAFYTLWEDRIYDRSMQKQLDVIIRSMRDTLKENGASDILEMEHGNLRVNPGNLDCDMYRFLEGDVDAINEYRGEYMTDYSWASLTESFLDRADHREDLS